MVKSFPQTLMNLVICAGTLLGILALPITVRAQEVSPPALFTPATDPPVIAQSLDPVILRSRFVEVVFDLLAQAHAALQDPPEGSSLVLIELAFFPNAEYTAELTRVHDTPNGGYVLSGVIQGAAGSEVHLSVQGEVLSGSISLPQGDYRVEYFEGGLHLVQQVNQSLGPPTRAPLLPPEEDGQVHAAADFGWDDDGSQIDVMVVYTANARAQVGGTAPMQARIAAEMDIINTGYANSGILHRMRLVHTGEVNYDEFSVPWENNLYDLTGTDDGKLDIVHSLRDQFHADMVVLVTERYGPYCGIAWVMQNPSVYFNTHAFSVVSYACMGPSSYTMAHESGHNLGAAHDRNTGGAGGAYPYARGYQSRQFYTIMAYSNGTSRINYWSNPQVSYNGIPTGIDYQSDKSADNVRALNQTALVAAQFRDAPPPAAPSNLAANPLSKTQINLSWTDNSAEENSVHVERAQGVSAEWQEIILPANRVSYADTSLLCATPYRYRVRAHGPGGYSAYTAEVAVQTSACITPPENLTALTISKSQIRLNWVDKSDNEDGFKLERRLAGHTAWAHAATTAKNTNTYLNGGLACETAYEYRLYAFDGSGPSQYTNIAAAVTALCPPSAFTGGAPSQSRIILGWVDNSTSEDGYRIERSLSGKKAWQPLGELPANSAAFEDSSLVCGTAYDYRLWAVKTDSSPSEKVQTTVSTQDCNPPPAPQGLSATALSGTLVYLVWQDVLDDEDYYEVQRRELGQTAWTPIAATAQNFTELLDRNLDWGQTYEYRVLAVNESGTSPGGAVSVRTYPYGGFFPLNNW